jgi:hypothetical protein
MENPTGTSSSTTKTPSRTSRTTTRRPKNKPLAWGLGIAGGVFAAMMFIAFGVHAQHDYHIISAPVSHVQNA